jgi:hypothetical protein
VRTNSLIPLPLPIELEVYKLEPTVVSSPPSTGRQYSSRTLLKPMSPSKRYSRLGSKDCSDSPPSWSAVVSKAKTISAVDSRTPSRALTSVMKETSPKSIVQCDLSTMRKYPSTRLRAIFVKPDQNEQVTSPGKHNSVTKPKGPVLLTQLRAERHKITEENSTPQDEEWTKKTTHYQSKSPETPKFRRPAISTLFLDPAIVESDLSDRTQLRLNYSLSAADATMCQDSYRSPIRHQKYFDVHDTAHNVVDTPLERKKCLKTTARSSQLDWSPDPISSGELQNRDRSHSNASLLSGSTRLTKIEHAQFTDVLESERLISSGMIESGCCNDVCGTAVENHTEKFVSFTPIKSHRLDAGTHKRPSPSESVVHHLGTKEQQSTVSSYNSRTIPLSAVCIIKCQYG